MTEENEYTKKLEESNKTLEATLARYIDKYGELKEEPPMKAYDDKSGEWMVGEISGSLGSLNHTTLNGCIAQGTPFLTSNANAQFSVVNTGPETITFTAPNIKFDSDTITLGRNVDDAMKMAIDGVHKKLDDIQKRFYAKPKPRFKRYCRVTLKKLKRIFK